MEYSAHRSANDLWIVWIDGGSYDSEIIITEGYGTSHNSAEVSGVGWIDEDDARSVWNVIIGRFLEFGGEQTIVFGAKDIEGFS